MKSPTHASVLSGVPDAELVEPVRQIARLLARVVARDLTKSTAKDWATPAPDSPSYDNPSSEE